MGERRAGGWLFPPSLPKPWIHHQPLSESSSLGSCCPVEVRSRELREKKKKKPGELVYGGDDAGSHRLIFSPASPHPPNKQTTKQVLPFALTSCDWVTLIRKLRQVTQGRSGDIQGLIYPRIKSNIPSNSLCLSSATCLLRMWEGASWSLNRHPNSWRCLGYKFTKTAL